MWDIENVIPSKNSNLVDGLLDFAGKRGNVSIAMAVGNWAENSIRHIAQTLSEKGFELFHMPQSNIADKKKKNSADFLIQGIFEAHELFHICVIFGLSLHWKFIYNISK